MTYKILFVASLHHPEALQVAIANTLPDQTSPLFPPSMGPYFWEKALKKRGHVLDVFYRNLPSLGGQGKFQRFQQGWSPARVMAALAQRIPASLNLEYRLRNRRLVEKARRFKPNVLWMNGGNTVIYPETLELIKRELGCKIIYASGVSPIVFSHPMERQAARLYDLVLVNDYYHGIQWLELGARRMECLPISACDPDFHHPYELSEQERKAYHCDVGFVGTLVPDALYSRRVQALETLCDFDLGIWSVHEVPVSLRKFVRGEALGDKMLQVLSAAKITINTHGDFMLYGGNMRTFEAAGVGVMQITDDLPGTHEWFKEGETIVTYKDVNDLREKVAYYLQHDAERERIVQRAREHVYQNHTYDQRMARVEALIGELYA
jgi:spore maturation protein CgeB